MTCSYDSHKVSAVTAFITATVLIVASAGKLWSWERLDIHGVLALIEPWLALVAVTGHGSRITRLFFAIMFLSFSRYVWWLIANDASNCPCFGNVGILRLPQVLVLDMVLGTVWLWLALSPTCSTKFRDGRAVRLSTS